MPTAPRERAIFQTSPIARVVGFIALASLFCSLLLTASLVSLASSPLFLSVLVALPRSPLLLVSLASSPWHRCFVLFCCPRHWCLWRHRHCFFVVFMCLGTQAPMLRPQKKRGMCWCVCDCEGTLKQINHTFQAQKLFTQQRGTNKMKESPHS